MRALALVLALLVAAPVLAEPPLDLELHFGASALLSSDLYLLGATHELPMPQRLFLAGGATFLVGFAKEFFIDSVPSGRDLAADALGTASGLLFTWALDRFVFGGGKP